MKKGFTLMELIIAIAIMVTAIALGYRIFFFGQNSFTKGELQNNVQLNVRFASELITRELQKANDVEVLSELPETLDSNKRYIYVDSATGKLRLYSGGSSNDALSVINEGVNFSSLQFSKNENSGDVLFFGMQADSGSQNFSTDSQVQILNIPAGTAIDTSAIPSEGNGQVICYSFADNAKSLDKYAFYQAQNPGLPEQYEIPYDVPTSIVFWYTPGTTISSLKAYFEYTGESIKVNGVDQISGVTANDFTNPVTYTITAEDGSTVNYRVEFKERTGLPPEAGNVRILVINSDPNIHIPYESSTLKGSYSYIPNDSGDEGVSQYQWLLSDSEDGTFIPIIGKTSITMKPEGLAGKWVKFGVRPVSVTGFEGEFYYSRAWQIFPDEGNLFWKHFINDVYTLRLPEEDKPEDFISNVFQRTDYIVESNMNPDQVNLNLTISNGTDSNDSKVTNGGAHIFKQITDNYLVDNTDFNSYSITVDAQIMGGSGYGVLLNGIIDKTDMNKDSGYMFQFDPGASGFLVRKIDDGKHNPSISYGLTGAYKQYAPSDIRNSEFLWPGSNDQGNTIDWRKPYKTEIVVQIQTNGNLIFKVTIIDEDGHRSNEMWFGDFGTYSLELYDANGNDLHKTKTFTGSGMPPWFSIDSEGPWLGLRTWNRVSGSYNTLFQEITLGDGFSMDISSAEFISNRKIKVKFDKTLQNYTDESIIKYGATVVSDAQIVNDPIYGQVLMITLPSPVASNIAQNGSQEILNISRGAIKQLLAGDIKIINGNQYDISGDVTKPTVVSAVRKSTGNNTYKKVVITFSEAIDSTSANVTANYSISGKTLSSVSITGENEVTLLFNSSVSTNDTINTKSVKDVAGNIMQNDSRKVTN